MFDLLVDMFDWLCDLFDGSGPIEIPENVNDVLDTTIDVGAGAYIISGVISLASLTYDSIRSELKKKEELKKKGAVAAVVTEFLAKADGYEITLDALNSMNESVDKVKMSGKTVSGIRKGTRISLQ